MSGAIALVGGNEFRTGCEDMDREIMRASGQNPARVLIIPTAAVTGPAKAANDGVTHFASLGAEADRLMVLDESQANDMAFIQPSENAGVVYFTGGSPEHLLATLKESQLLKSILAALDRGAVLAGSSAGAMVMGSLMREPSDRKWVEALGIVPGTAILPHHESRNPADTSLGLRGHVPDDLTLLGIDAKTGCLGRPGNWRVVGSGKVTVYRGGDWEVYQSGAALPLDM
jgi:cyanophycinase